MASMCLFGGVFVNGIVNKYRKNFLTGGLSDASLGSVISCQRELFEF
jgi:hypothetical protein